MDPDKVNLRAWDQELYVVELRDNLGDQLEQLAARLQKR